VNSRGGFELGETGIYSGQWTLEKEDDQEEQLHAFCNDLAREVMQHARAPGGSGLLLILTVGWRGHRHRSISFSGKKLRDSGGVALLTRTLRSWLNTLERPG
jgi:hypothetical protein